MRTEAFARGAAIWKLDKPHARGYRGMTACVGLIGCRTDTGPYTVSRPLRRSSIAVDQAFDAGFDLADEWAVGEQRRMELHEARARTDLRIGVFGTCDHAEVDQ